MPPVVVVVVVTMVFTVLLLVMVTGPAVIVNCIIPHPDGSCEFGIRGSDPVNVHGESGIL